MEVWRTVEDTDGMIQVSNYGRFRSLLRGEPYVLKTQRDSKGYHRLRTTINRDKRSFKLHREVARAFIPNPNNYPQVNHIDGNKDNNAVTNLEWCTNKYNANQAIKMGLWDTVIKGCTRSNQARQKGVTATNGIEAIEFNSVSEAERYFNSRHISDVLKGKRSSVKGWTFTYRKGVIS